MSMFRTVSPLVVFALSSLGCSEAVPVASEGGYSVSFLQAATTQSSCKVASHNAQVGGVTSIALDALDKDSVDGSKIQCSVTPNGAGFAAAGAIEDADANHLDFLIPSMSPSATEANPATGTIGFRSSTTQNIYRAPGDQPCKFWIEGREQLDAGRIWVSFKCQAVNDPGHDSSCQISAGSTLAMQNCDQ